MYSLQVHILSSLFPPLTQVFVVPPTEMSFLPSKVEALIDSHITLPLQVKGYASLTPPTESSTHENLSIPFSNCRKLKIDIQSSDSSIFNVTSDVASPSPAPACTLLTATALTPGHTRVTVTYEHRDIFLQAVVTIAAYSPLRLTDPEGVAVVTLGSSSFFVFEGGPAPWVLDKTKFRETCELFASLHFLGHVTYESGHVTAIQYIIRSNPSVSQ